MTSARLFVSYHVMERGSLAGSGRFSRFSADLEYTKGSVYPKKEPNCSAMRIRKTTWKWSSGQQHTRPARFPCASPFPYLGQNVSVFHVLIYSSTNPVR